jgi:hypothetical protein
MAVTARFKVSRVTPMGDEKEPWAYEVEMTPDYAEGRNKDWSKATPSGVCRMTITNFAAVDYLSLGKNLEFVISQVSE